MLRPPKRGQQIAHASPKPNKHLLAGAVALLLCLTVAGGILAKWGSSPARSRINSPAPASAPPVPPPSNPSKEYIYSAGSRLIATEEPPGGGSSALSAPASLTATANVSAQVNLSWAASTGGTVQYYEIQRCQNLSLLNWEPPANTTSTSFTDTTVLSGKAYLYRVRAVDSSNNYSPYSNLDYATAKLFQPITANSTAVNADDFNNLRDAVNAVRVLANLQTFDWTAPAPTHNGPIKASHIQQLRTNMDQALQALSGQQVASATGFLSQSYTDPVITSTTRTRKAHVKEIRDRVKGYQVP